MDILHIGGIADKSTMNLPESVKASRHSFKAECDFPTDVLEHDDYERQTFSVEQPHPAPRRIVQVMIQAGMPESVASVLVGAHFGGAARAEVEEPN